MDTPQLYLRSKTPGFLRPLSLKIWLNKFIRYPRAYGCMLGLLKRQASSRKRGLLCHYAGNSELKLVTIVVHCVPLEIKHVDHAGISGADIRCRRLLVEWHDCFTSRRSFRYCSSSEYAYCSLSACCSHGEHSAAPLKRRCQRWFTAIHEGNKDSYRWHGNGS
jgi:hypothetical protein